MNSIIVSYIPLLRGQVFPKDFDAVRGQIDELPSGRAIACAWVLNEDGNAEPVLIFEDAQAIAEHLHEWAESKPESWFKLHWTRSGDDYMMALIPDIGKTMERIKIHFQLKHGYPMTVGDASVFFQPLHFVASRSGIEVADRVKIRLLDAELVQKDNFTVDLLRDTVELGEFTVERDSDTIKSYFNMEKKEKALSFISKNVN